MSPASFELRKMTLEDIPAVMEIEKASFSLPWPESAYRYDLTEQPAARLWVAQIPDEDGEIHIAGVIVVWLIVDEVHIGTIGVHPAFRRRGIGRALLTHALKETAAEGALISFLEVRRSNLSAQSLYQKMGYKVVNVRKHYYQDNGEDALLMTLEGIHSLLK